MNDAFLISELFKKQDQIFITHVFKKNLNYLLNLGLYIKNKNLPSIPFEREDFEILIWKSIKLLKNVAEDSIKRFGYLCILRTIFIQQVIATNRKFLTNKEKVLTTCIEETFDQSLYVKEDNLDSNYILSHDLNEIYINLKKKFNKPHERKILSMYLNNVKPKEIAKRTKLSCKKIYNVLFLIKNYCNNAYL